MYKYQCSKDDCKTFWALNKGNLNGFVLTCPICGKGRGLFVSEYRGEVGNNKIHMTDEMIIWVNNSNLKSISEIESKVDNFIKRNSLLVVSKEFESVGNEFVCCLQYKFKE
ncbi:MAG: hypothetical protein Q8942_18070 [Bacillota bacterium]|nr:hypothetical protein [Bacillota bacterium]